MKVRNLSLATVVILAAVLAGCAAVRYEPTSYDSPKPVLEGVPGCLAAPLAQGGECLALVRADQWWSDTGVSVKKGAAYRLTVPAGQTWFDKGRVNYPPYGEIGSWAMNLFAGYKRQKESLWFSLIAAVVEPGLGSDRPEWQSVDIGKAAEKDCDSVNFIVQQSGALSLYPNDARGPLTHSTYFYENNSGQIWVRVRWLTGAEASGATKEGVAAGCKPPPA